MSDLIKRSIQILGGGVKQTLGDYTTNFQALINDANTIRTNVTQTGKSSKETLSKIKSPGSALHKLSNWFYQKEMDYEDFDLNDEDDFDAGFEVDSNDSGSSEESKPRVLDADSMKDITKGQLNAMYKIGGKQSEVSMANTAEIVSSLNNRSTEIIASVNNINSTLIGINDNIKKLVEFQTQIYGDGKSSKLSSNDKDPLLDYSGRLTLANVFNRAKQNQQQSELFSGISMIKDTISMADPEMIVSMILSETVAKKKFKILGNNSIDDIGNKFDEAVGTITHNVLSELIESPKFKRFFGDITKMDEDKDYNKLTPNHYTTKPAVFDGMTRHSIIHVIPEYLKKINESISGQTFEIDSKGHLTTNKKNTFSQVTRNAFSSTGISHESISEMTEQMKAYDSKIDTSTLREASKVLEAVYVMHLHKIGRVQLRPSQLSVSDITVMEKAAEILAYSSSKSEEYWSNVCLTVMTYLTSNPTESSKFVSNVNRKLQRMIAEATERAKADHIGGQTGKLSFGMMKEEYRQYANEYDLSYDEEAEKKKKEEQRRNRSLGDRIKGSFDYKDDEKDGDFEVVNGRRVKKKSTSDESPIESSVGLADKAGNHNYSMLDYARGIFGILNRGINVRVTNSKSSGINSYDPYDLGQPSIKPPPEIARVTDDDSDINVSGSDKKTFLGTMADKLLPRSLRLSMQFFGGKIKDVADELGVTETPTIKDEDGNDIENPNSAINKIKNLLKPVSDKITRPIKNVGRKIIGEETYMDEYKPIDDPENISEHDLVMQDDEGYYYKFHKRHVHHTGLRGLVDKGKDFVNDKLDMMQDSVNYRNTANDIKNMKPGDDGISPEDQLQAQQIFAMMETSLSDGDGGADIGSINSAINNIKNEKLRARVQNAVIPMIQRSSKKDDKKGIFGTIGSIIGSVFSKAFSGVKKVLSGIFKLGKKLLGFVGRIAKAYLASFKTGVSNIGRGLFGQKAQFDENGNQTRVETDGLLKKPISVITGLVKKGLSKIESFTLAAIKKAGDIGVKLVEKFGNAALKVQEKLGGIFDRFKKEKPSENKSVTKNLNDLANSDLGFMQGMKDSLREAKEAALKQLKPQTYGDKKLDEMTEVLSGKKKSIFKDMKETLDQIFDRVKEITKSEDIDEVSDPESSVEDLVNTLNDDSGKTEDSSNVNNISQGTPQAESNGGSVDNVRTPNVTAGTGASGTGGTTASGGSGGQVKKGGKLYSAGQAVGGALATGLPMLQMVTMIIDALSAVFPGFKDLVDTVKSIFTDALQPLNKVFTALKDALMPILETLMGTISIIVEMVGNLLTEVIEIISPILEAVGGILGTVMEILEPILDIIIGLVKVILAPLMGIIQNVVVPILEAAGATLEVLSGVVQMGFGIVITALGGLLTAIGTIIAVLTLGMCTSVMDAGVEMTTMGADLVSTGFDTMVSGIEKLAQLAIDNSMLGEFIDTKKEDEEEKEIKPDRSQEVSSAGSVQDGVAPQMDKQNFESMYETTGSGDSMNQHNYGSYMNMSERGCGPIVLTDAYNRRTGSRVSPLSMASSMNQIGAYNTDRGTSVRSMLDTSHALGMNARVGGVTQRSLKQASPRNPITILGSGSDYGTRKGNDHYMNVIGTDNAGGVYVSNPMTGRVSRRPISTVVQSSRLGIYGSGDSESEEYEGYKFDSSITGAMKKLTSIAGSFLSMFNTDENKMDEEDMQGIIDKEKTKAVGERNMLDFIGRFGKDKYDELEAEVRSKFESENPKLDGESDEEYEMRAQEHITRYFTDIMNDSNSEYYRGKLYDGMKSGVQATKDNIGTLGEKVYNAGMDAYYTTDEGKKKKQQASNSANGSSGEFVSVGGATIDSSIIGDFHYKTTNITSSYSGESPIHEFFAKMVNPDWSVKTYSDNGNWYGQRNNPNSEGQGSSGETHGGIDILWDDGKSEGKPLYAITKGTLVRAYLSDSAGYNVKWKDDAGYYHWYMHMSDIDPEILKKSPGAEIKGLQTLGHVGNTGTASNGAHLHYSIMTDPSVASSNMAYNVNPLTYFAFKQNLPTGSGVATTGASNFTDDEKVYSYLVTEGGMTPIGAAGLIGCFKYESDMRSNNLENVYNERWGISDKDYTAMVDSGEESEENFVYGRYDKYMSHQEPGKAVGYGIGQQTSPELKQDMYDRTVKQGLSISTLGPQLDGVISVLKDRDVYDRINDAPTPTEANQWFLWRYEAGTGYNSDQEVVDAYSWMGWEGVNNRHQYAEDTYNRFKNWTPKSNTSPTGKGSTTGYGMVSSPWDASIVKNALQTNTKTGISSGIVNTVDSGLNLRQKPSTSSNILTVIPKGTSLTFESSDTLGWLKTSYNGNEGYVSKDYVLLTDSYLDNIDMGTGTNKNNNSILTSLIQNVSAGLVNINDSDVAETFGSGDIPGILDFNSTMNNNLTGSVWYDHLMTVAEGGKSTTEIPPLDPAMFSTNTYTTPGEDVATVINNYEIKSDDTEKRKQLKAILTNTYNVRAERIEELLEKILEKMEDKDGTTSKPKSNNIGGTTPKLFDDDKIPSQVMRLYTG